MTYFSDRKMTSPFYWRFHCTTIEGPFEPTKLDDRVEITAYITGSTKLQLFKKSFDKFRATECKDLLIYGLVGTTYIRANDLDSHWKAVDTVVVKTFIDFMPKALIPRIYIVEEEKLKVMLGKPDSILLRYLVNRPGSFEVASHGGQNSERVVESMEALKQLVPGILSDGTVSCVQLVRMDKKLTISKIYPISVFNMLDGDQKAICLSAAFEGEKPVGLKMDQLDSLIAQM